MAQFSQPPPPPSSHTRRSAASRGASLGLVCPTIAWLQPALLLLAACSAPFVGVDALVAGRVNGGIVPGCMPDFRAAAERRGAGAANRREAFYPGGGVVRCLRGGEGEGGGGDGNAEDDASWQRLLAEGQAVYRELKREQAVQAGARENARDGVFPEGREDQLTLAAVKRFHEALEAAEAVGDREARRECLTWVVLLGGSLRPNRPSHAQPTNASEATALHGATSLHATGFDATGLDTTGLDAAALNVDDTPADSADETDITTARRLFPDDSP
ncbi:hypothetical protein T484DRAFT_1897442, partial [Baffinella frigidus]